MRKAAALLMASALISVMVIPGLAGAAAAAQAEIQATVSLRSAPSTSGKLIEYLHAGDKVAVLDQVNSYWYKVQIGDGQSGYVSSSSRYIDVDVQAASNGVIVSAVSFRTSPSTKASRMRYLAKGEKVMISGQPNKYWYEVKDSYGTKGYISTNARYIDTAYKQEAAAPAPAQGAQIEKVITAGMKYLGTPYEFGSSRSNTSTFDCSDFVRQAFLDGIDVKLPMDSRQQGQYVKDKGRAVYDINKLHRGDLMFFMSYKGYSKSLYTGLDKSNQTITHTGIYLGNGQILHTYSNAAGGVKIDTLLGNHWEYRFLFGGSVVNEA